MSVLEAFGFGLFIGSLFGGGVSCVGFWWSLRHYRRLERFIEKGDSAL